MPVVSASELNDYLALIGRSQLLPRGSKLFNILLEKLNQESFDAGATFSLAQLQDSDESDEDSNDEAEAKRNALKMFHLEETHPLVLVSSQPIAAGSDGWLIDHCWSFRIRDVEGFLREQPTDELLSRVEGLIGLERRSSSSGVVEEGEGSGGEQDRIPRVIRHMWTKALCFRRREVKTAAPKSETSADSAAQSTNLDEKREVEIVTDEEALWYFLDEVGSALLCSPGRPSLDTESESPEGVPLQPAPLAAPNVAIIPLFLPQLGGSGMSFFFPIADLEEGDIVYAQGTPAMEYLQQLVSGTTAALLEGEADGTGPSATFSAFSLKRAFAQFTEAETVRVSRLAEMSSSSRPNDRLSLSASKQASRPLPWKVFTDSNLVAENIELNAKTFSEKSPGEVAPFVLATSAADADIIWLCHQTLDSGDAFPNALFLNQFPKEEFLFTNKKELAKLVRDRYGSTVSWFAEEYDGSNLNLRNLFVGHWLTIEERATVGGGLSASHRHRQLGAGPPPKSAAEDDSNLWIVKPHNMARSMDMVISSELTQLIRLTDAGPKLYCQYISRPRTMRRRKFDLRFIVLLSSLEPQLEVYLFEEFWIRFSAEEYSLENFGRYDKHWTVMNYGENKSKMLQMKYYDFIKNLNQELSEEVGKQLDVWSATYRNIKKMTRESFQAIKPLEVGSQSSVSSAAAADGTQNRSSPYERYRGMYGLDVILRDSPYKDDPEKLVEHGLEPVLLEITYSPDCHRACVYHPTFYYDVFSTLYLGRPLCVDQA